MLYHIFVKTKQKKDFVKKVLSAENTLIVSTKEVPKEGKANLELIKLLADYLNTPSVNLRIARGLKSKTKIVEVKVSR